MIGKRTAVLAGVGLILLMSACGEPDTPPVRAGQQVTVDPLPTATATAIPTATATMETEVAASPDVDCSATLSSLYQQFDLEELAWSSHQVVVGTVAERQPSEWGESPNPSDPTSRVIFTTYVMQVEQRLRGQPSDRILVRQMGGTIGDCTQEHDSEPQLAVGQLVLLFLREEQSANMETIYHLTGGPQAYWKVKDDGTVSMDVGHLAQYSGMPLATIVERIQTFLAGPPLEGPLAREYLVPVELAPISTPFLLPTPSS